MISFDKLYTLTRRNEEVAMQVPESWSLGLLPKDSQSGGDSCKAGFEPKSSLNEDVS